MKAVNYGKGLLAGVIAFSLNADYKIPSDKSILTSKLLPQATYRHMHKSTDYKTSIDRCPSEIGPEHREEIDT